MIKKGFKQFTIVRQLSKAKALLSNIKMHWQLQNVEDLLMPTNSNDHLLSDVEKRLKNTRY